MKISPQWLRDFVDLSGAHQLADDLTLAGIAVESISGEGDGTVFDMDITHQPSRRHESFRGGARMFCHL
jgi:hypothetical protein